MLYRMSRFMGLIFGMCTFGLILAHQAAQQNIFEMVKSVELDQLVGPV